MNGSNHNYDGRNTSPGQGGPYHTNYGGYPGGGPNRNTGKILAAILIPLGVLILGLIVWFVFFSKGKKEETVVKEEQTVQWDTRYPASPQALAGADFLIFHSEKESGNEVLVLYTTDKRPKALVWSEAEQIVNLPADSGLKTKDVYLLDGTRWVRGESNQMPLAEHVMGIASSSRDIKNVAGQTLVTAFTANDINRPRETRYAEEMKNKKDEERKKEEEKREKKKEQDEKEKEKEKEAEEKLEKKKREMEAKERELDRRDAELSERERAAAWRLDMHNRYAYWDYNDTYYYDNGFIFPDSDVRYLSEDELWTLGQGDLRLALNEIYARHGYIFKDQDYYNYYANFSWYYPSNHANDMTALGFNEIERYNANLIIDREKALGYR